jgi:hypothetical protein
MRSRRGGRRLRFRIERFEIVTVATEEFERPVPPA